MRADCGKHKEILSCKMSPARSNRNKNRSNIVDLTEKTSTVALDLSHMHWILIRTIFLSSRNKFTWIQRRCSRVHTEEEGDGALIRCDKMIKRKLLTTTRSPSSSSSGMKCAYPCPSRPKKLRTISDNNTSPNVSDDNGSCKRLTCLGGRHKCRHDHAPKRVLFKDGTNNLELCHVVCAASTRTNYHLQRNNFGDYELVPSDSSNSKQEKDVHRI